MKKPPYLGTNKQLETTVIGRIYFSCYTAHTKLKDDVMQWIKIDDQLPENRSAVIASDGESVSELYFDKDKFQIPYSGYFMDEYDIAFIANLTHWTLLPKAPED